MTEQEWLTATDPMLEFLYGKASHRKLRLFAAACCRAIWHLMDDPRSREAVIQVENYVDGLISVDALHAAHEAAGVAAGEAQREDHFHSEYPASAANFASDTLRHGFWDVHHVVGVCAADAQWAIARANGMSGNPDPNPHATARTFQADLLRDIFGNPFRPVVFDPSWFSSTVVALARGMYESRDFSTMPILADALQDAGCENQEVLCHCRSGGPHVRGCFVVDALLGKG